MSGNDKTGRPALRVILPHNMDAECIALCDAMNRVPGIRTHDSCCGHDKKAYAIWFCADSLESLPDLLYWFDACHCGYDGWYVDVRTDCAKSPVHFTVRGPVGPEAYEQAKRIAELIEADAAMLAEKRERGKDDG